MTAVCAASAVLLGGLVLGVTGLTASGMAARDMSELRARVDTLSSERDAALAARESARSKRDAALAALDRAEDRAGAASARADRLAAERDALRASYKRLAGHRAEDRAQAEALSARLDRQSGTAEFRAARIADLRRNVAFLDSALRRTAAERDSVAAEAGRAFDRIARMDREMALQRQRTDRVFVRLESALSRAIDPLQGAFRKIGLDPDELIAQLAPQRSPDEGRARLVAASTKGGPPGPAAMRAGEILDTVADIDLYRRAAEKLPLSKPVMGTVRYTSPFGMRTHPVTGRRQMHEGVDMAGPVGTPILATGDGKVTFAGWQSGYGRIVVVRHAFGFETAYPHLSRIRVTKGEKVSRGERIGDMGSTGWSTGSHLHYEVRAGGEPVDPMTYIRAASDVF